MCQSYEHIIDYDIKYTHYDNRHRKLYKARVIEFHKSPVTHGWLLFNIIL